ncbi:MAG: hypothetical protein JO201_01840 [Verrucomicrobia bacterium]|nr:hypothetical protein [Verrucomicrobiota bacterium]
MNTSEHLILRNKPAIDPGIVRHVSAGSDYQPDWRDQVVDGYLAGICKTGNRLDKTIAIHTAEPDEFVKIYLEFCVGVVSDSWRGIDYAFRCARNDPEAAWMIKAMVVGGASENRIAFELGTKAENILAFERIYFDARRFCDNRAWLRKTCYGPKGHRWLQVAFRRGMAGVVEVVLHQSTNKRRSPSQVISVLLGRADDSVCLIESANTPLSAEELSRLAGFLRNIGGKFPYLEDKSEN